MEYFQHFDCLSTEKKSGETSKEKKMNGTMDENSNSSIISIDGKDQSDNIKEEVSPKRIAKRTVKAKTVKYGSDEDDDNENQENMDDNVSDYMGSDSETEKKVKKTKTKAKAQVDFTSPLPTKNTRLFSHPRKRKMP